MYLFSGAGKLLFQLKDGQQLLTTLGVGASSFSKFQVSHGSPESKTFPSGNSNPLRSVGEYGHSSSLASFKVPSSLQASPTGLVGSFWLPFSFKPEDWSDKFRLDPAMLFRCCAVGSVCSGWAAFEYALPFLFEWADTSAHTVGQLASHR